jgi:opacity protein-like surface antigen
MRKILLAGAAMIFGAVGVAQASTADRLNGAMLDLLRTTQAPAPVAAPAPARATGINLDGFYIGANMGQTWRDTNEYTAGALIGYQINRFVAAELTYDFNRNDNTAAFRNGQMAMANLVVGTQIGATAVRPYAMAGAGIGWNGWGSREDGGNLALWNVGGGVRVNLVSNIDVDARYRYVGAFNHMVDGNSHLVTVGLNLRF